MCRLLPLLFLLASPLRAAEGDSRKNILFVFADDWGRYASIFAEHEKRPSPSQVVKTPNIDRVAKEGALFRNAFVNAPSCTPCRSSLLSGRYFFNTGRGAILQTAQWDPAIPSFPLLLKDSGYHIGKSFKVWSPGTPADAPFGQQQHAYQKSGGLSNNFSENVTDMVAKGETIEAARQKLLDQVKGNFDSFLADRKPNQPWLYWFGTTTTHRMWIKGSGKALWKINPDDLKGKLPAFLPDVPEVREDFADYLGEIQAVDAYVGVLLKQLEAAGELEKTMVVLSGDHGPPGFTHGKCNLYDFGTAVTLAIRWPGGDKGRVVDDFVNLMDLCPTFLEIGGVKAPDGVNGRSFLDAIKGKGSGYVDQKRDFAVTGRERHVAAARKDLTPYPSRALRTRELHYIRNFAPDRPPMGDLSNLDAAKQPTAEQMATNTYAYASDMDASPTKAWLAGHRKEAEGKKFFDLAFANRPAEELYDIANDPDEMVNLAGDPKYAEARKKMADRLMDVLTKAGDPRVTGAGDTFEKPPFTNPNAEGKKKK